jgi:hypothetical protein
LPDHALASPISQRHERFEQPRSILFVSHGVERRDAFERVVNERMLSSSFFFQFFFFFFFFFFFSASSSLSQEALDRPLFVSRECQQRSLARFFSPPPSFVVVVVVVVVFLRRHCHPFFVGEL